MKQVNSNTSEIIETFPGAFFILELNGDIFELNKAAFDFCSQSKEELIGLNFKELIKEEQKSRFTEYLQKVSDSLQNQSGEFYVRGVAQNYKNTLITAKRINLGNNANLISLALLDLTYHEMQAVFIKESQKRFETIANSAPVMIWISDVEGLFSFVNKIWCEFTGREMGNELGLGWLQNVHPDHINDLLDSYKNSLLSKSKFSSEFLLKNNENEYKWILMVGTPRYNQQNNFSGLIGTCSDISKQKENEEKISKINEELAEIIATKDKFFSIISHDLRSPLYGLTGILELISNKDEEFDDESKQQIMEEAYISSKNIYQLMENLLEWANIQTGKIAFEPQNLKLLPLVLSITGLYSQNLKAKGIELTIEINSNVSVYADKKFTETILRNLLSNAIKFTHQNGHISIVSDNKKGMLTIYITDDGVGIDSDTVGKLFRIDKAQSTKGTAKESGTGLGLILCKELVENQNGTIWVDSVPGEGSTFCFTVPESKQ